MVTVSDQTIVQCYVYAPVVFPPTHIHAHSFKCTYLFKKNVCFKEPYRIKRVLRLWWNGMSYYCTSVFQFPLSSLLCCQTIIQSSALICGCCHVCGVNTLCLFLVFFKLPLVFRVGAAAPLACVGRWRVVSFTPTDRFMYALIISFIVHQTNPQQLYENVKLFL